MTNCDQCKIDGYETQIRIMNNINASVINVYIKKRGNNSSFSNSNSDSNSNDNVNKIKTLSLNVNTNDITAYQSIRSGKYTLIVKSIDNYVETLILSKNITFKDGNSNTIVISNNPTTTITPNYTMYKYNDVYNCPVNTYANMTFTHQVSGAGAVDIYFNGETTPSIKGLVFNKSKNSDVKVGQNSIPGSGNDFISFIIKSTDGTKLYQNENFYAVNRGLYSNFIKLDDLTSVNLISVHNNRGKCQDYQKKFCVERYMGRWFQISSIPLPYGVGCVNSEANYTLFNDKVKVFNICYNSGWVARNSITGSAVPIDCNPSTLLVKFDNIPELNSTIANYIILKTDYKTYAVVGSPTLSGLYILSREKTMCQTLYNDLIKYSEKLGYDINLLKIDENSIIKC